MMSKAIPQAIIKSDPPCDLAIVHTKQTLSVAMLELKERELSKIPRVNLTTTRWHTFFEMPNFVANS